ncbi:cobalt-precorrin 5A hydrolase [Buttiauxella gaviniae]|uniref:Cobalt-precorrin 5A hydrolase n=1 Tax=Buttiauxella gaviniae TaxID=82990 RepID=A0ABV3NYF2_9ENTR
MNTARPESVALFCLTPGGVALAQRLRSEFALDCFTSEKLLQPGFIPFGGSFAQTVEQAFSQYSALVFIAATGIVVRVIAPLVCDKMHDPAVVVMDERAEHVISLLSGHLGGANELTRHLAEILDSDPVITTATDVNQLAALDTLAAKLDATLLDFRQTVKTVNQMLVSQKRVGLWWDRDFAAHAKQYDTRGFIPVDDLGALPALDALVCVTLRDVLPAQTIPLFKLVPKRVIAGMGCRRDTPSQTVATLFSQQLAANHFDPLALRVIGSVTLKKDERALLDLAQHHQVPFEVFSVEQLAQHEHRFPASEFVRQTVGVGSVSQPAAWLLSHGNLVGTTLREQGVTITLGVIDRC